MTRSRASALALTVILTLTFAAACTARGSSGGAKSTPTAGATTIVDAPIESIDIVVRESSPPGYTAHIVSGLPSGCAKFDKAVVIERTGNHIAVKVTNTMPADKNTACTAIYGTKETNLDLGTNFKSGESYTVDVNDKSKSFVAQ